jgi:hypothetical protein
VALSDPASRPCQGAGSCRGGCATLRIRVSNPAILRQRIRESGWSVPISEDAVDHRTIRMRTSDLYGSERHQTRKPQPWIGQPVKPAVDEAFSRFFQWGRTTFVYAGVARMNARQKVCGHTFSPSVTTECEKLEGSLMKQGRQGNEKTGALSGGGPLNY